MVGWLLLNVAATEVVRALVPRWIGDLLPPAGFTLFLVGCAVLAQRWWPTQPPQVRPPLRADIAVALPRPGSARRALVANLVMAVVSVAVTIGFIAVTVVWARGDLPSTPDDGPVWFTATVFVAGSVTMGLVSLLAGYQTCRMHRVVHRVESGLEPRWLATVLHHDRGTVTVHVTPVHRADLGERTVRVNTLADFADLRPGDEIVFDGPLRRGDLAAVPGRDRARWVGVTWRQPHSTFAAPDTPARGVT